jgi:aspartate aminotransferase-like enzyme
MTGPAPSARILGGIGTTRKRLMVGGPTSIPPEVAAAGAMPVFDERTPEFAELFGRVTRGLRSVLRTEGDVLTFACSATGAQESVIQNLFSPGDRVLVVSNGFYGERWAEMCRAFRLGVVEVASPWGRPLDLRRVAATLAADPAVAAVFAVHGETSTGMTNDMAGLAATAAGRLCVVDAASSVGACELATDEWGLDVVVAASQKALMTPPGLAFVSVSERAWSAAARSTMPRYYFDWASARQAYRDAARTPFTPAVGLIGQLDLALARLRAEGLPAALDRHALLGRIARAGCTAMGFGVVAPAEWASPTLTAVRLPAGVQARDVVDRVVREHGVQLAAGSGDLVDQLVRIGHCGDADVYDVATAVNALELTLHRLGVVDRVGPAGHAMQGVLADRVGVEDD